MRTRPITVTAAVFGGILAAVGVVGASGASSQGQRALAAPYALTSPFNTPIPGDAQADQRSSAMVSGLVEVRRQGGFLLSVRRWTVPIYFAGASTPRYDVSLSADWARQRILRRVPIPSNAQPDPGGDAHMVVVDRTTACEFDFWQARKESDRQWSASWANEISTRGSGVYARGLSARGSGFALLAGLVWPWELKAGHIDHALVFTYPFTKAGGPVAPATESDGRSTRDDAIPEGARLQLDPTLDLNTLSLPRYELIIARALQKYGMYLADTGGSNVAIPIVSPQGYAHDPYSGVLPDTTYAPLSGIPLERMRVLRLGPQRTMQVRLTKSACAGRQ
jgi:hypothetical protein